MINILVAEDNKNARKLYDFILRKEHYTPILAEDGLQALAILEKQHIDLIILDVMMPHMDGFTFAKELRDADIQIPILMISAKDTPADKREGFLSGTDDYMVKPIDEQEFLLRIKALLRRARISADKALVIGNTKLMYDSFSVTDNNAETVLPRKEFLVLYKLLSYPNKTFTRTQLMDEIWSMDTDSEERTVDVHINRLREKFGNNPDFRIITVRGLGYKAVISEEKQ